MWLFGANQSSLATSSSNDTPRPRKRRIRRVSKGSDRHSHKLRHDTYYEWDQGSYLGLCLTTSCCSGRHSRNKLLPYRGKTWRITSHSGVCHSPRKLNSVDTSNSCDAYHSNVHPDDSSFTSQAPTSSLTSSLSYGKWYHSCYHLLGHFLSDFDPRVGVDAGLELDARPLPRSDTNTPHSVWIKSRSDKEQPRSDKGTWSKSSKEQPRSDKGTMGKARSAGHGDNKTKARSAGDKANHKKKARSAGSARSGNMKRKKIQFNSGNTTKSSAGHPRNRLYLDSGASVHIFLLKNYSIRDAYSINPLKFRLQRDRWH